ncbi:uncharacterized protein LOC109705725 [Ananas comosus]|uniref:ATP-dependent DNA helicase n=1 Tax=Ananas comosus TaxID=4615 RepID=A0A6P5EFP0_ANACO|nr:uncharacterized protein LOC109705725 [Ananas comosus]
MSSNIMLDCLSMDVNHVELNYGMQKEFTNHATNKLLGFQYVVRKTLPLLQSTPELLDTLLDYGVSGKAKHFRKNIRTYNSMFALTSFGAKVDNDINRKLGPYVFKISGQNYHRMYSLLPMDGHRPKFAQLYIYDTENEIDNRMRAFNSRDELQDIDRNIVRQLMEVFDSRNEVVKAFRMARDRFREANYLPIRLRLIGTRPESGPQYNPPMSSEIAGLIIGDFGTADRQRDIIVEHKMEGLKRITDLHPSFMAMQYPILFPYGDVDGNVIGKKIILPSSFTAGPRYMIQNYQDAIAICRHCGHPDLFITFTCNTQWLEIQNALLFIPGQRPENRPDIVSRVFKIKVDALMADIKNGTYFGMPAADLYTIEFQKRGLPHVHILVWLQGKHRSVTPADIDLFISAEIPDKNTYTDEYQAVSKFMMHGPCGSANPRAPCMAKGYCSKYFSKEFRPHTVMDENGFAIYKRRNNGEYVTKNGVDLDNCYVVPHNLQLVVKYQAHINVEWCNKTRLIKYLFKYINKGPDRIRAIIEDDSSTTNSTCRQQDREVDEIKKYLDCRYLSAYEAVWRLFQFDIHCRDPTVERLTIHLPLMNNIVYHEMQTLDDILRRPDVTKTMFTEWMATNQVYDDARELTYVEFPTKWVWHSDDKIWTKRKKGHRIGRIVYIHPNSGELYFLRMLLNKVKGARNYTEIRTVNGIIYETFRAACDALELLGDDLEWRHPFEEAAYWSSASDLRQLFVTIIMFCEVADPVKLWNDYWESMSDDIIYRVKNLLGISSLKMPDAEIQNYVLCELELLLNKNNSSLVQFKLPLPNRLLMEDSNNRLLREELDYDSNALRAEHMELFKGINRDQLIVYSAVLSSVYEERGNLFFVYGHGGTGKTYLWRTIIAKLRSEGRIVLAVASSGIASLLLPGGRTAHSRFKIPVKLDEFSTCEIKKRTQLAKLLAHTSLIIWDEAPMNHRNCFEALDKSLQDILQTAEEVAEEKLFGGKTVLLGGDFRQILPFIVGGTRQDVTTRDHPPIWPAFAILS